MCFRGATLTIALACFMNHTLGKFPIRYTQVRYKITGIAGSTYIAGTDQECAKEAFNNNALAIELVKNGNEIKCTFISHISAFSKLESSDKTYFVADLRDGDTCDAGPVSVSDIYSSMPKCNRNQAICSALNTHKLYCDSINAKIEDCEKPNCADGLKLSEGRCCPEGFSYMPVFSKCIGLFDYDESDMVSQDNVNEQCFKRFNSALVTIENNTQNEELGKKLETQYALIGLQIPKGQSWSKNGFKWVDGSSSTYFSWHPDQPDNGPGTDARFVTTCGTSCAPDWMFKWADASLQWVKETNAVMVCSKPVENPVYQINMHVPY